MGKVVTLMGRKQKAEKTELKKHAATIHCSNTLSLLQRKIANALLFHAYKELMQRDEHIITVKQLCKLIGYQGNNHAAIREAMRGLISTVIEWNLIDDHGEENWTASSIIASVSLKGPLCYYAYSPRMKALLHTPSMFGKIDLLVQSQFRSSYGLALYENCIRYRGLPYTKWLDLHLFKKLMGVPKGKYDVFRDFKRRVLDKAVDEVNAYSDLIVAPELVREGRKVTKVRFKLKERAKKLRLGQPKEPKRKQASPEQDLKKRLVSEFHFTKEQALHITKAYDRDYIEEKIQLLMDSRGYQMKAIKNISAYLMSAIKHNYKVPDKSKVTYLPVKAETSLDVLILKRQVEEIWMAYHAYREQMIEDSIHALPEKKHDSFMRAFFKEMEPAINSIIKLQRGRYTRETILESPQIRAQLRRFALRELEIMSLKTLEEFVETLDPEKRQAWKALKAHDPEHYLLRETRETAVHEF